MSYEGFDLATQSLLEAQALQGLRVALYQRRWHESEWAADFYEFDAGSNTWYKVQAGKGPTPLAAIQKAITFQRLQA